MTKQKHLIWGDLESRQHLLEFFESPALLLSTEGRILACNEIANEHFRIRSEDMLGMIAFDLMPDAVATHQKELFQTAIKSGERLKHEERSDSYSCDCLIKPLTDENGHVENVVMLLRDVTVQENAQRELTKTKDQLDAILKSVPGALLVFDKNANFYYGNDAAFDRIGVSSQEELRNMPPQDYLGQFDFFEETGEPISYKDFVQYKALRGEPLERQIVRLVHRQAGIERWAAFIGVPITNEDDEVEFVAVSVFDITEQKNADLELKEAHDQFEAILKAVPGALLVYDKNANFYYGNDAAFQRIGVTSVEEVRQVSPESYFKQFDYYDESGNLVSYLDFPHYRALRNQPSGQQVVRIVHRETGIERWGSFVAAPAIGEDGEVEFAAVSVFDITEQKNAEFELKDARNNLEELVRKRTSELEESQKYLEWAQRIAKLGHFIWDVAQDSSIVSDGFNHIMGAEPGKQWSWTEFSSHIHPEDVEAARGGINTALESRVANKNDYRVKTLDGRDIYVSVEREPVLDDSEEPTHIMGTVHDITERKNAELELRRLNEELEGRTAELAESQKYLEWGERIAKLGYFVWDFKTDTAKVSEEFNRMMDAETGKVWSWEEFASLVHPDDLEVADRKIKESVASGKPYTSEYRVKTLSGKEMYLADVGEVLLDDDGEPYLLVGAQQDITERKKAELELKRLNEELEKRSGELRESRTYLERAQHIARLGHFTWHAAEDRSEASEQLIRMTGVERDKPLNVRSYLRVVHPDDRKYVSGQISAALEGGQRYSAEHRIVNPEGGIRFVYTEGEIERKRDGTLDHIVGTMQDITKRKESEAELKQLYKELGERSTELKESRLFLERAQKIAAVGHFVYFVDEDKSVVSEELMRIMGTDFADRQWSVEQYLSDVHPDDRERVQGEIGQIIAQGTRYSTEHRLCRPDGSTIHVTSEAEVEQHEDGRPFRIVGTIQDITRLKAAELELKRLYEELQVRTTDLQESREYLERAQRTAKMGYFIWNVVDDVSTNSEQLNHIVGLEPGDFLEIGEYIERVHPDDREVVANAVNIAVEKGERLICEYRMRRADGEYRHFYTEGEVECDDDGDVLQVVGMTQDITRLKEAELELRKLHAELEERVEQRTRELHEANEELEAFSSAVSHDLRAPLRHIRGFSEALRDSNDGPSDANSERYINRIVESAEHMDELITALLWLSRTSKKEPDREAVDLSEVAGNIVSGLQDVDPEREVAVEIPPHVVQECDERLISAVLENLFSNAWKFTAKTEDARIEFGSEVKNAERIFFVRDNGAGFDPEQADGLFQPFKRLHDSQSFPGIGIGLATVKRVIERHGGRIWAEGKPNEGATFYFTLK